MHGNIDKIIYGLIGTYILSFVVDKLMYGVDAGKLALIVTEKGPQIAAKIDELSQRGATLIKAEGSYTGREKEVSMFPCIRIPPIITIIKSITMIIFPTEICGFALCIAIKTKSAPPVEVSLM